MARPGRGRPTPASGGHSSQPSAWAGSAGSGGQAGSGRGPRGRSETGGPKPVVRRPGPVKPAPSNRSNLAAGDWSEPLPGASYPLALSGPAGELDGLTPRFRGLFLVIAVFLAYLVVYLTVSNGVNAIGWLAAGRTPPWADYVARAGAYANPLGLWAGHLGLFALVLPVWAAYRFLHRRKLTWLWSISPGVRWRYGLTGLLAAVAVLGAVACFLAVSGPAWDPPANWPVFAIAIVLSSPLQALGEEVLFRGYLLQVLGLIVRRPWFPIVVSAALFGYFHGSQNLWLFLSRFAFGLVAGALVWRTGGLEAGIAAHAVNNVLAFGLALATGSLAETRATTEVAWSAGLRDVVVFAVFGALAWLLAWAMRLPNRAPALPSANRRG